MQSELIQAQLGIYRFFSTIFRDELSLDCVERLTNPDFRQGLLRTYEVGRISKLMDSSARLAEFLGAAAPDRLYRELRFKYAELFLNVGPNPVFPYESCHVSQTPLVQQRPLFDLREFIASLDISVDPSWKDLTDHIAVEFDLCAHLLSQGDIERYEAFFAETVMGWAFSFLDQLRTHGTSTFYSELAFLARAFLECCRNVLEGSVLISEEVTGERCRRFSETLRSVGFTPAPSLLKQGARPSLGEVAIKTHCYTCGALCGMTAKVRDGVLVGVSGLPGDPKGGGKLCIKGGSAPGHINSAYRLKTPLIKEDGRFRKASWDEALDVVAQGIRNIPQGKLAYFRGNDFQNSVHEALFDHLGCPKGTHRTMCDNSNRMATEHMLSDKRPWINYAESDYILHFGMNELSTSYGQRKTAALKAALKRGAKLVVIDPRKSETAAKASEWIQIKPAADGAVAMAMAYVIISEDLYDKKFVRDWTHGFEAFKNRIMGMEDGRPRTPEWAEDISGVPAATIARIAREFATSKNKAALSWTGLAQLPNAHHATAAVQALNGLCGTFDAPGGPSLPFKRKLSSAWNKDQKKPAKTPAPKVDTFDLWSGWSPALFERQVDEGKIKGLVSYWGDPVLTWGNSASVERAMGKLDFSVAIDAYMCNTALLCDVVLPDATWLEQSQLKADWLYEAFLSYFAEVTPPMYDSRPIWKITQDLAAKLGVGEFFPWKNADEISANQLIGTPWSLERLKEDGFIITDPAAYRKYEQWGSLNPPEGYASSGRTRTGKFNFLNPVSQEKGIDALPDFKTPPPELAPDEEWPYVFVNFRLMQHEHCSTFNNYNLMRQIGANPVWINDIDAGALNVADGMGVIVESPWGRATGRARVTADIARGVIGAAGGFGHVRGLEGDPKYPDMGGVNFPGELMPPNTVESAGGTPPLKYIKARVRPA